MVDFELKKKQIKYFKKFNNEIDKVKYSYSVTKINQGFLSDSQSLDFQYLEERVLDRNIDLLNKENKFLSGNIDNSIHFNGDFLKKISLLQKYYEFEMAENINKLLKTKYND
jgi:hypothetical protein